MKSIICLLTTCISIHILNAQKLHLNASFGASNYSGDLQVKRYTFNQAHPAIALGLTYELSEKLNLRTQITRGKLSAHDKYNPLTAVRNLNFTSSFTEGHIAAEYMLRDLSEYSLSPYVFAGIAVYHFNPYTHDTAGTKYFLQPLGTEGQGYVQGRKVYKLTQFAIPFGGGIKLALSDNIRVGVELGMRKLFTDYLDDVSTTYINYNTLTNNRGSKAVDLAWRAYELKTNLVYPEGENRGSAKYKDWYYFTGITISFRLGSKGWSPGRSNVGCPTRI